MQMAYLARLYEATKDTRFRDAFQKAVEYLLSGQYENGEGVRRKARVPWGHGTLDFQ